MDAVASSEEEEENLSAAMKLLKRRGGRTTETPRLASSPTQLSPVEEELNKFLEIDDNNSTGDFHMWWQDKKEKFPTLVQVVREVLATPASSASSERVFSVGTQVRLIVFDINISQSSYFRSVQSREVSWPQGKSPS